MTNELTDCAIFSADFPDDSEFSENGEGDLMVPGGKEIAIHLVKELSIRGIEADQPFQHSYYAWLIEIQEGKAMVRCYLQGGNPWLLISEAKGGLFFGGEAKEKLHRRVIAALMDAIKLDSRFSGVQWETKAKLQATGKIKR